MQDKFTPEITARLRKPFRVDEHGFREEIYAKSKKSGKWEKKPIVYIDISSTIDRLLTVAGDDFSIEVKNVQVNPVTLSYVTKRQKDIKATDELPEGQFYNSKGDWVFKEVQDAVFVTVGLTVFGITRDGIGSHAISNDPDMSAKSAYAEAVKKASNEFGIALYLWDEYERDRIVKMSNEEPMKDPDYPVNVTNELTRIKLDIFSGSSEAYNKAAKDFSLKDPLISCDNNITIDNPRAIYDHYGSWGVERFVSFVENTGS